MAIEMINNLPFTTPSNNMNEYLTVNKLIEELEYIKNKYDMEYPDNGFIDIACSLAALLSQNISINELKNIIKNTII